PAGWRGGTGGLRRPGAHGGRGAGRRLGQYARLHRQGGVGRAVDPAAHGLVRAAAVPVSWWRWTAAWWWRGDDRPRPGWAGRSPTTSVGVRWWRLARRRVIRDHSPGVKPRTHGCLGTHRRL